MSIEISDEAKSRRRTYKSSWEPLDEAAFGRQVMIELNARGWELHEEADGSLSGRPPKEFQADGIVFYLHNFYVSYLKGTPLSEIIEKIAGAVPIMEELPSWEEARDRIALQLREPLRIKAPDGRDAESIEEPSRLPGLVLALVLDFPEHIASVTRTVLERWGVGREEALARAREQTLAKLPRWTRHLVDGHRYWVAANDNGYAATAIAFPESLAEIPVEPEQLWLSAPARDVALAFEGDSPERDRFIALAAAYIVSVHDESDHARSRFLYRVKSGGRVEVAGLGELPDKESLL